ncbi:hypothetical protein F4678DRAFT_480447 [Xylaria arbuscula]|nr:hypothetical protein F4678DRAFT_480447 [Xylaria arbuscula]
MVRRLREAIASRLHNEILSLNQAKESSRNLILLRENQAPMTMAEKFQHWTEGGVDFDPMNDQSPYGQRDIAETMLDSRSLGGSSPTYSNATDGMRGQEIIDSLQEQLTYSTSANPYQNSVEPAVIMDYFTKQSKFNTLIAGTKQLFERYHGHKIDLIRQRVSLALRRDPGDHQNFSASFSVDWTLAEFLTNNYDSGVDQKLYCILATMGGSETAKMCTVGEYMSWCWPSYNTQLIHVMELVLRSKNHERGWYCTCQPETISGEKLNRAQKVNYPSPHAPKSQCVAIDSTLRQFKVQGTEDFIISIAQQLSWLAAVCQEKSKILNHAYVDFLQAADLEPIAFDINVKLEVPSTLERSCWNEIVGPAAVVNGFPLPDREPEYQGLEVSISIMASLAGLSQAVTFGGGFVFKGRYHALVPIRMSNESIQWHLINTSPKRLMWADIDEVCPRRLLGEFNGDTFWQKRSFLGWCPRVMELLGTTEFDYGSVQYSKANKYSRRPHLDKITVGFSQWAQITGEFTLGKKDGFRRSNELDDYEMLLDDAKSIHVIIHDTVHRRAYQTNAEDLILHIIHHRQTLDSPNRMNDLEFADVDRRAKVTRSVMHNNSEKVICMRPQISGCALKERRFKEEVKLLFSTFDGLWANDYECQGTQLKLELPFKQTASTFGWEYMDVVRNCRRMLPKTIELRKTCGRWNVYAKDIQALVLFGANFGDILKPASAMTICSTFSSLPKNECYLAVRADVLEGLFNQQGSLGDRRRLTPSGYTLIGPESPYKPCDNDRHRKGESCNDTRVLRVVKRPIQGKVPILLELNGAIIIGDTKTSLFQNILHKDREEKSTSMNPDHQQNLPLAEAPQGSLIHGNLLGSSNHKLPPEAVFTERMKPAAHSYELSFVKSPQTYEHVTGSSTASNSQCSGSSAINTSAFTSPSSNCSSQAPLTITRDLEVSNSSSPNYPQRIPGDVKGKQPLRAAYPNGPLNNSLSIKNPKQRAITTSTPTVCIPGLPDISQLPRETPLPTIEPRGKRDSVTPIPTSNSARFGLPDVNGNIQNIRTIRRQPKFSS